MALGTIFYRSMVWKLFQMASSFFVTLLFARTLQSAVSAELYSLVYALSLVTGFFTLGLDIGLNYFVSRLELGLGRARILIIAVTVISLLACLPLILSYYSPALYPDLPRGPFLLFSALQVAGVLTTTLSGALFTARGRNHLPTLLATIINGLLLILIPVVSRVAPAGRLPQILFLVYFLSTFLQGIGLLVAAAWLPTGGDQPAGLQPPGTAEKSIPLAALLRFSLGAFLVNYIFLIAGRVGIYLLPGRVPPAILGNYIQAYKLVEWVALVPGFFYFPFITLVVGDQEAMAAKVLFLVRLSNTLAGAVALAALVLGWFLFPYLFGPSFGDMYRIFLAFIPGLFPACASGYFTAYFYGAGQVRLNAISAGLQLVSGILLVLLLTPYAGATGCALAYSGSALVSMGFDAWAFRRFSAFRLSDILFLRKADFESLKIFAARWSGSGKGRGRSYRER